MSSLTLVHGQPFAQWRLAFACYHGACHHQPSMLPEAIETKKCSMCGEAKSLSSFSKNKQTKDSLEIYCKTCNSQRLKEYRQNNRDKTRKYCQNNRKRISQHQRKYYKNNRDKELQRFRKWRQNNPDKNRARAACRRAAKRNATPPWADKAAIEAIYAEALWLQEFTGEPYHVDHIVPLISDFVCGLHVPANLQALLAVENLAKNNHSWPEQLPCQTRRGIDHQWWNDLQLKINCNNWRECIATGPKKNGSKIAHLQKRYTPPPRFSDCRAIAL